MRLPIALTTGWLAAICDAFAGMALFSLFGVPGGALLAVCLHALAVWVALIGATRARGGRLRTAERDCVVLAALFLPLVGPLLAWMLPHRSAEDQTEDAHAAFERYLAHTKAEAPRWERTLFTGDVERDLARELDAQSFEEVFRYGPADQKRNAVKRLAELGTPEHLRQIRECLVDPDQEVRLFAHNELDRILQRHQTSLQLAQRALDAARDEAEGRTSTEPTDPTRTGPAPDAASKVARAQVDLCSSHLAIGACGALDRQASAFHFRVAAKLAREVEPQQPVSLRARIVETRARLAMGDLEGAEEVLQDLAMEFPATPEEAAESRLVQAEVAYSLRRFDRVRQTAVALRQSGEPLPPWMEALAPAEVAA